jgi:hypothetical protein
MILGGSFISTGDEASVFARFSFRRHFFQHCGFRLVRSVNPTPVRLVNLTLDLKFDLTQIPHLDESSLVCTTNCQYNYEAEDCLRASLLSSYPTSHVGNFSSTVQASLDALTGLINAHTRDHQSVLLAGSATGALAFELTKSFNRVIAADYCGAFIHTSQVIQSGEQVTVSGTEEAIGLPAGVNAENVIFKQLTWIPVELGSFPVVIFHDYLDRTTKPYAWLVRLREVVSNGGVAIITSTGNWDANAIAPHINSRFSLVESKTIEVLDASNSALKPADLTVTVWQKL